MNGKTLGYIRVSTIGQNTIRQLEGMVFDKTFIDRASAKDTERPALTAMLDYVRDNDIIRVHSIDRLARNLSDLLKIVESIISKGARIEFVKEALIFSGDSTSTSLLMLSIMGAFAAFERALILERQREGIEIAKNKGVYKGRLPTLTETQVKDIHTKLSLGVSTARIARELSVSRATIYNYIKISIKEVEAVSLTPINI